MGIEADIRDTALDLSFLAAIGAFAVLSVASAHSLHQRAEMGAEILAGYVLAIGLHFGVIDHELRSRHGGAYLRFGRWPLVVAVIAGWLLGYLVDLDRGGFVVLLAFVSGSVILNAMLRDLGEDAPRNFAAFVAGVAVYGLGVLLFL